MNKWTNGQLIIDDNKLSTTRYCKSHTCHGFLYTCDSYPENIKEEIKELAEKFNSQCRDGTIRININSYKKYINNE